MKLRLPEGKFGAYLFDCDGTIVDSMPLHYMAWKKALGEWGCKFDEDLFYTWGGRPTNEIIATLNQQQGLSMPVEAVSSRKEDFYFELLPQLTAIADVVEHIEAEHGRIPFAVVSGSKRDSVIGSLTSLKLLDRFDMLVCAEDYAKSKPDPEAYLLAASKLGVAPADCLVFEDTDLGIQAAKARDGDGEDPSAVGEKLTELNPCSSTPPVIPNRNPRGRLQFLPQAVPCEAEVCIMRWSGAGAGAGAGFGAGDGAMIGILFGVAPEPSPPNGFALR